tara:strand:+ start:1175 stop:1729 length:555 start_codon:yes stop_codon:yes gene_type:complete
MGSPTGTVCPLTVVDTVPIQCQEVMSMSKEEVPLPMSVSVHEFDDYVAGYRAYSVGVYHTVLHNIAHRLALVDMKDADVNLLTPNILHVFNTLRKQLYVDKMIDDVTLGLTDELDIQGTPLTQRFIEAFTQIMIIASVRQREIHDATLRMSELKYEQPKDLQHGEQGEDNEVANIPSFTALDEA